MNNTEKKITLLDSKNFLENVDESTYEQPVISLLDDPIRYFSTNYWTKKNGAVVSAEDQNKRLFSVDQINDETLLLSANKTKFLEENILNPLEKKFSSKLWEDTINSIIPYFNKKLYDSSLSIDRLFNIYEFNDNQANTNFLNREFIHNFYDKDYSNLVTDKNLDVRSLPDIFSLNEHQQDNFVFDYKYRLSYGGLIGENYYNKLFNSKKENNTLKEYFSHISKVFYNIPNGVLGTINQINSEFRINSNKNTFLKNINYIPYPYYVDIKFTNLSKNKNSFFKHLNEVQKAKDELISFIMNNSQNSTNKVLLSKDESIRHSINNFNLKTWLKYGLSTDVYSRQNEEQLGLDNSLRAYKQIEYANIVDFIKNNIKQKVRKYSNLMEPNYLNEIILFKIEKRQFGFDSDALIQTFWIEPDDSNYFRVIDTQLRYDNKYYYKIYAYVLNISNEYEYSNYYTDQLEMVRDISNGNYKVKVDNKPQYEICELEIGRFSGSILLDPLKKPKVKVTNNQNVIKFDFENTLGEEIEDYRIIEDEDFKIFQKIKESQQNSQDKIKFINNQELNRSIQIYKTTNKPVNYLSFQGKRFRTITGQNLSLFTDVVVPGVKYYYMFRYLNQYGYPSNPSAIYEVELKDEDGYMYLNIREVDLDKKQEISTVKNLKRYLLIRPSVIQLQPTFQDNLTSLEEVKLGPDGRSIWNSSEKDNFILRITSKKTNRMLEFNLGAIINRKNK